MMARTAATSRLKLLLCIVTALSCCSRAERVFTVVEGPPANQSIGRLHQSGGTGYEFTVDSPIACGTNFTINSMTSVIETVGLLDREVVIMADQTDRITCYVAFRLDGTNTIDREPVTIQILDINDYIPRFSTLSEPHNMHIVENLNVPSPILTLQPRDYDNGINGTVSFRIVDGNDRNFFRIDRVEGDTSNSTKRIIYLQKTVDYEALEVKFFNLTINITDMGTPPLYRLQRINIAVNNSPDESPTFPTSSYMFSIQESQQIGPNHPFGNVTANNVNQVHGGTVFYSVIYNTQINLPVEYRFFSVIYDTGELYLNRSIDFDDPLITSRFPLTFTVRASNPGINGHEDALVQISLEDVNENPPLIICSTSNGFSCPQENTNRLEHSIIENSNTNLPLDVGHFIVHAGDLSMPTTNVTVVSNPPIQVTKHLYFNELIVRLEQSLDREETPIIIITLTAYEPTLSGTATILIQVEDVNDNVPVFLSDTYQTQISDRTPLGRVVTTVTAVDADRGENGTVSYAIASIDKSAAKNWFQISETTGEISVSSLEVDYNSVNGRVVLTVTATDNGIEHYSSSATVTIDISPIVTFTPASYLEFKNLSVDVNSASFSPIYIEFRTIQPNGLLLFQPGSNNNSFGLQLKDGRVHCWFENGIDVCEYGSASVMNVHSNEWYSVSLQRNVETGNLVLSVWLTDFEEKSRNTRLLTSSLISCTERATSQPSSLFIGGLDPFSFSNINLTTTDFVGLVHNVLIGNTKIDLGCPSREENTIRGSHDSDSCDTQALSCDATHSTGCVGHEPEPYCRCLGGFPPQACSVSSSSSPDNQNGYAPIRFHGNTRVDFTLGYSFFYDLELQRAQVGGVTREDIDVGRRKRQGDTDSEPEETIQSVNISFRPVEESNGVLLYSRTGTSVHILKVMETEEPTTSDRIIYMVSDVSVSQDPIIYIPVIIDLENNTSYDATIKFTNKKVTLTVHYDGDQNSNADSWEHPVTTFAEQPSTFMSIGGTNEHHLGFFVGCISSITINTIDIPLNGLLTAPQGGFIVTRSSSNTGSGERNDGGSVESNCDLCDLIHCGDDMQCVPDPVVIGNTSCECPTRLDVESKCTSVILPTTGPLTDENGVSIYIIIGGACGGVLIAGLVVILLIVLVRVVHVRRDKQKRTYSVRSLNELGNGHSRSTTNQYEFNTPLPRDEPVLGGFTSLNGSCATSKRGSSVSTYQEHCEDADPETDTPRRYSRRKSTTSAESGIKTDTDRDPSIRSREIPRMDDSGNERDTDYSPPESESDDLTSSCCMETALSPVGLQLVGSSNSLVGLSTNARSPLTPQERKIITPLRPPSTNLSMSELDDIHVGRHNRDLDTDAETEFSYPLPGVPHSPTRNGMPVVLNRPVRTNSDSDKTSRSSTPKWYKSSTASDTEREKERIQSTRPYYTTHTSPPHKYSHNAAPEYRPPPAFSDHKGASPLNPNPRNKMMHTIDSPLARNTHKYENHPLPYLEPPVRDRRHEYDQVTPDPRSRQNPHSSAHPTQPMRYRQLSKPYSSTMATRRQNSSDINHSRDYNYRHIVPGTLPSHFRGGVANRSFSTGDAPPSDSEHHFQDLKSVSTINPISYWEMQDRMKAAVDQVDPYHVLSEPYVQFEDVSTSPSVTESQITLEEPIGPEHQVFESQGGGEGGADINPIDNMSLTRMQDNDLDSVMTESDIGQGIKHFPSADCSDEYTATLVATSSTSEESTPKLQPRNGYTIPLSQRSFDV